MLLAMVMYSQRFGSGEPMPGNTMARRAVAHGLGKPPTPSPTSPLGSSTVSLDILHSQLEEDQNEKFERSRPIFVDIGMNTGEDLLYHLQEGYSVLAVDAFEPHVTKMKSRFSRVHKDFHRVLVFNVGLSTPEREGTLMPLYFIRKGHPMASFNKEKACYFRPKHCKQQDVKVIQCKAVFELLGQPADYVKIDIEMLHHVCLQALHLLPPPLLPKIVCWEDHDRPFGPAKVPTSLTDLKLILGL